MIYLRWPFALGVFHMLERPRRRSHADIDRLTNSPFIAKKPIDTIVVRGFNVAGHWSCSGQTFGGIAARLLRRVKAFCQAQQDPITNIGKQSCWRDDA